MNAALDKVAASNFLAGRSVADTLSPSASGLARYPKLTPALRGSGPFLVTALSHKSPNSLEPLKKR